MQKSNFFIFADSLFYEQGSKIVWQVIFILLTLSIGLFLYEKVKFSLKIALQTETPFILADS